MFYFITLSLYWLAFWLFYRLLLEREKFFQWNRAYLLLTFLLGLVLPIIPWSEIFSPTDWASSSVIWLNTISILPEASNLSIATDAPSSISWLSVVWGILAIGSTVTLWRFVQNLWQLRRLIVEGSATAAPDHTLIEHPAISAPYSWFHYLFWKEDPALPASERQAIITHELAHIRQRHSWDLMLFEVARILFWWNPLWYAYRKSLTEVHEYLADAEALASIPRKEYGKLLLRQTLLQPELSLIHTFHTSQLKKRIIMMTKSPSSFLAAAKYLLFLPFLLLVLIACEDSEARNEIKEILPEEVTEEPTYFELVDTVITFDPATNEEDVSYVKRRIYEVVDEMPVFGSCADLAGDELKNCSNMNLISHLYEHVTYPKDLPEGQDEGMALTEFVVNKDGTVTDVRSIKGKMPVHPDLSEAAANAVRSLPNFRPGMQDGKPVSVKMVLPMRFKMED